MRGTGAVTRGWGHLISHGSMLVAFLGCLWCFCPLQAVELRVRLHRQADAGWKQHATAESTYPFPASAGKNVHNGLVKNRVELKVTEIPPGESAVNLTVSVEGGEGWGHELEQSSRRDYVCWVWEEIWQNRSPKRFIRLTFRAESGDESDEARVQLFPPPDVSCQRLSPTDGEVRGENFLIPPTELPPRYKDRERVHVDASHGVRQTTRYRIRVRSVAAATYAVAEMERTGAAICRYFDNGTDITDQVRSSQGYESPEIPQGTSYTITVSVTSVGRSSLPRSQRVSARIKGLSDPAVSLGAIERFDSVTCRSTPTAIPPLLESWNEEQP